MNRIQRLRIIRESGGKLDLVAQWDDETLAISDYRLERDLTVKPRLTKVEEGRLSEQVRALSNES